MKRQALLGPVELAKERHEFLMEAAQIEPDLLPSLLALLPEWSKAGSNTAREGDLFQAWMKRFNLENEWMWLVLRCTLNIWSVTPPREPLEWPIGVTGMWYRTPLPEAPDFRPLAWEDPEFEAAEKYVERVSVAAKRAAWQHVEQARESLAASSGWRRVPWTRKPDPRRLRWLAQYQIAELPSLKIATASEVQVAPSSVYSAVTAAAERIGLKLRAK